MSILIIFIKSTKDSCFNTYLIQNYQGLIDISEKPIFPSRRYVLTSNNRNLLEGAAFIFQTKGYLEDGQEIKVY